MMQPPARPPKRISIDEFRSILIASEVKLELIDGTIVPFANGTVAHHSVCERVVRLLRGIAQPGCDVFTSQFGIRCAEATYVFPDATYRCGRQEVDEADNETSAAPQLIIEVMSPHSIDRDRIDKVDIYLAVPSIQEYVLIDSRRPWAGAYRRSGRGWNYTSYGLGDVIEFESIGAARIELATFYATEPAEP